MPARSRRSLSPADSSFATLLALTLLGPRALAQEPEGGKSEPPEVFETQDESGSLRVKVVSSTVGWNDPSISQESILPSPDGRRLAYLLMEGGQLSVVVDGEQGEPFDGLSLSTIAFSEDSAHVSYVGTRKEKTFVVVDGREYECDGISEKGVVFAPGCGHYGWVAARGEERVAVVDGKESAVYFGIAPQGITFSPDGNRHAFIALTPTQQLVVVDGEEGPMFDSVAGFQFSNDGKRFVYVGQRGTKSVPVVDGEEQGEFDKLRPVARTPNTTVAFSFAPNGHRYGFLGARGEEWFAVIDGKETGPFTGATALAFSKNGAHCTYIASRGHEWFLMLDGEEQKKGDVKDAFEHLSFSPDEKRLAIVYARGNAQVASIDGVEGPAYDQIHAPGVIFSPGSKRTMYLGEKEGRFYVVLDGQEYGPYAKLARIGLGFSPAGERAFYSVKRAGKEAYVVDGIEGPAAMRIGILDFTEDGQRYAYLMYQSDNEWSVVIDGIEHGPDGPIEDGQGKKYLEMRDLVFSKDGRRYAYAAKVAEDKWTVVIDGVPHGPDGPIEDVKGRMYEFVGNRTLVFSQDGEHFAYAARRNGRSVVVADGREGREFNLIAHGTVDFTPDGEHLVYFAARAEKRMVVVDGLEIDHGWDGIFKGMSFAFQDDGDFHVLLSKNPRIVRAEFEIL